MTSPVHIPRGPPLPGTETYREKAVRKFQENPWVPIGCAATVGALTMATFKLRRGQSQSFNYWLRARVAAQGLTIVAVVVGTYSLRRKQGAESTDEEAERRRVEKAKREKEEFEERLRGAEEAYGVERALMAGRRGPVDAGAGVGVSEETETRPSGRSWLGWLVGRGSSDSTSTGGDKNS